MSTALTCPVCSNDVAPTSSMCLSCHLPIKHVKANQPAAVKRPRARAATKWIRVRLLGIALYSGIVAWAGIQIPTSLTFLVPAAVIAGYLHVIRGRPWIALLAFSTITVVAPLIFWPSLLTDALGRLTDF